MLTYLLSKFRLFRLFIENNRFIVYQFLTNRKKVLYLIAFHLVNLNIVILQVCKGFFPTEMAKRKQMACDNFRMIQI